MKRKLVLNAAVAAVIVTQLSCQFITGAPLSSNEIDTSPIDTGPVGKLSATVTSPVSVLVKWPAASGATRYLLEVKYGDLDFFPLAEVAGDQTSFEDFPAPDNMDLTYRLQVVTASGTNDGGTISVTTPVQEPNPLTVQAHDYEPVPWTPPTVDPLDPNFDPSSLYPPGFDPNNPDDFDPSSVMTIPSVTEIIGPEGGAISMTSPDDVSFMLTIPAGALDAEVPITLTPIESIDGLPLSGGLLGAVRIDPEGLLLEIPALLQISLPEGQSIPAGNEMYSFAFYENGKEFHLQPFAPEGGISLLNQGSAHLANVAKRPRMAGPLAQIAARQLQPQGVGAGTQNDARSVVQDHRPTSNADAATNKAAYEQSAEKSAINAYRAARSADLGFSPNDPGAWHALAEAFEVFENHLKDYDQDKNTQERNEKTWDRLLDMLKNLLEKTRWKCVTRDDFYALSIVQRMNSSTAGSFGAELGSRFKKAYGEKILEEILEKANSCKYTLGIASMIGVEVPDKEGVTKYFIPVTGTATPLKVSLSGGTLTLSGSGKLKYGNVEVVHPSANCTPIKKGSDVVASITVTRLDPLWGEKGEVTDWVLRKFEVIDPKGTQFKFTCKFKNGEVKTMTVTMKGKSIWHGYFTAAHMPDQEFAGWLVQDAGVEEVENSESDIGVKASIIAKLLFIRAVFMPMGGFGNWCEDTTFNLYNAKNIPPPVGNFDEDVCG